MSLPGEDTIAAVATPAGEGGLAVIRISGPDALSLAGKIFFPRGKTPVQDFASHTVHAGRIRNKKNEVLDQALLTFFRGPRSYTGEDVVEISFHGGIFVARSILGLILLQGARIAEPGEFTKRAFLNKKLDLSQAEAVIDLIRAKSRRSAEMAARQLEGDLSRKFRSLRDDLMKIYAHMEAYLDFPDEDIEVFSDETFKLEFKRLGAELEKLIQSFMRGSLLREGVACVLAGKPNVGKSSLFNALLERDRALVSEHPGTTRDYLEESLEINGFLIRLSDTAGLFHSSGNPLDEIGMQRAREAMERADLVLFVVDGTRPLGREDAEIYTLLSAARKKVLILVNKCDLGVYLDENRLKEAGMTADGVRVSARTRSGMETIEQKIEGVICEGLDLAEGEQITRERHRDALCRAREALARAEASFLENRSLEFVVLDLRASLEILKELIGEIFSDDLLGMIFSEFCIGK